MKKVAGHSAYFTFSNPYIDEFCEFLIHNYVELFENVLN
jgi:hypothetical protein